MNDYKYKFSIVIPIYNVEKYLEETIESVLNQTIGFKKNIQIIFVNDGSKDNSEKICLKYKEKYPENIIYIKQENAGVSTARNHGMQYIEGKYVNFLDGDDKWSTDAFEKIYTFFEKNSPKVDLVAGRMQFFDAQEDFHALDYKFKKTKVVDIFEDYGFSHLHITSSVIKSEVAKQFKFTPDLKYGEDAEYVNELILEKHKYGVIKEANHFYRKRSDLSSAVQNKEKNIEWYTKTLEYFYENLMNISIKKYGRIIPYIQYLIMYDLQWRIKPVLSENLEDTFKNNYINRIIELLQKIEDHIICEQRNIYSKHKMYVLSLKHNRDIRNELEYKAGKLYFNNISLYNIRKNKSILKIDILEIYEDKLIIEGRVNCPLPRNLFNIYVYINSNQKVLVDLKEGNKSIYNKDTFAFKNDQIVYHYTYKVEISLENVEKLSFLFDYKDEIANRLIINFGKFSKLSTKEGNYYATGNYIIAYNKKNIIVGKSTKVKRIKRELRYAKQLIVKEKKWHTALIRFMYFFKKIFQRKEIWIVSDREEVADDNGEHFFKYLQKIKNKNIKTYFALNKTSIDYKRMKKTGKVIDPHTLKYKILFLLSSKIVSSQANDNVINAFGEDEIYFKDLLRFKFIFLQHGITKDDLSKWLKKYDKNISIFVTVARPEYESIINGDYYYTEEQVKLVGFPRYDKLTNNKKKSIIIFPTQRKKLVEWNKNDKYGKTYNPFFKESEYFKYYNRLINDKRIIEALKKYGYKMKLGLHPLLVKQINDFDKNESVEILSTINYQKEFRENALLITDYSSVAFDFAYLNKPIIYTQFDTETFYEGQVYDKGYYDYERDGFGPICYDYEDAVKEIIKAMENNCEIEEKYLQRIKKFYKYEDNNNCKRVYEEILKI